jgi:two-component system cell cycle sensor histidine kinase/response regulator CckA
LLAIIAAPTSTTLMMTEELDADTAPTVAPQVALVVEDDGGLRMFIARVLSKTGYLVLQAVNGVEALDIVRNAATRIDIVITDVWMPGMGGEAFAREFRHERPDTPIVFISGQEPDASVESILENGEAVFLSKPFSREALEMVILSACERVRSQG